MHQSIHNSFSNISANQSYAIDDVVAELQRVQQSFKNALTHSFETALISAERPRLPERSLSAFNLSKRMAENFIKYGEAIMATEELKKEGVTRIVMNPQRDLCDQVIAAAKNIDAKLPHKSVSAELHDAESIGEP